MAAVLSNDSVRDRHLPTVRSQTYSTIKLNNHQRPPRLSRGTRSMTVSTMCFDAEIPSSTVAFHRLKRTTKRLKIVSSIDHGSIEEEEEQSYVISPTTSDSRYNEGDEDSDDEPHSSTECMNDDGSNDGVSIDSESDDHVFIEGKKKDQFQRNRLEACVSSVSSEGQERNLDKQRNDSFSCSFRWSVA